MAKNILLLFLSPVPINPKDGTIRKATYENLDGAETENTNESAVLYLLKKNIALDQIFILASKKVREETFLPDDSRTHLDFFRERVGKFLPNVDYFIFDYDENISGNENIQSVAVMSGQIQKYAAQFPDEKIILHVDLTGGMRDTNMMMLDLTRLLEYSGLQIGLLLYSNLINYAKRIGRVDELQNIYDLFQLIAGVEEFVNFGSVTALKNYYADKKISEPLTNLLAAMENFAEAIKLCHYGQFSKAIKNLYDAVQNFAPAFDDAQDILMARLIGRIRKDYHRLIVNLELDDLEVIRWCLEKGYLQQALTLYTERIPEYLRKKRLITQQADEFKKLLKERGKDVRSENFYLLNAYKIEDGEFQSLGNIVRDLLTKDYVNLIKDIPNSIKYGRDYDEWQVQFETFIENFCEKIAFLYENAPLCKEHIVCEDAERLRRQYELLARVAQEPQLLETATNIELAPLKFFFDDLKLSEQSDAKRRKIILNSFAQIKGDTIKKYFPKLICTRNAQIFRLKMMIDAQIFSVTFDEKIFFSVMEKYFRIKDERNQSNHAREDEGEFKSARELRDFMFSGIDELDAVLNK